MTKQFVCALALAAGVVATANAQVVVGWNFNLGASSGTVASFPITNSHGDANNGAGSRGLTLSGATVASNNVLFTGTTTGAANLGGVAGNDLATQFGASGANSGAQLNFAFDNSANVATRLLVAQRSTGSATAPTGPTAINFTFSTNGGTTFSSPFTVPVVTDATYRLIDSSTVTGFDSFLSGLNGASNAVLRLSFVWPSGASTSSNIRLDNFQVVPTPGSVALLALGGLVAARRRRA